MALRALGDDERAGVQTGACEHVLGWSHVRTPACCGRNKKVQSSYTISSSAQMLQDTVEDSGKIEPKENRQK